MRQQDVAGSGLDVLSPPARQLLSLDPAAGTRLLVRGPGSPTARVILENLTPQQLLSRPVTSASDAEALLAGLWLWYDWLDESHRIAQGIDTPTGSFWHAIMHRREGDFANSKYWYARCPEHPMLSVMAAQAGPIIHPMPADTTLLRLVFSGWDPAAFVDLVEEVHDRPDDPRHAVAVNLQVVEWRLLFDHCLRRAVEPSP